MNNNQRDWKEFALLAIDLQRDFWSDEIAKASPNYPGNISQLFKLCRSDGIEIIHLRASYNPDQSDWMPMYKLRGSIPCVQGTGGEEVLPFAIEKSGEKVFMKKTYDGFINTGLLEYLNQKEKRFVLCAGLVTSICVFLTTASAAQNNFLTAIIEDCCADKTDKHLTTLNNFDFIFYRTKVNKIQNDYSKWSESIKAVFG